MGLIDKKNQMFFCVNFYPVYKKWFANLDILTLLVQWTTLMPYSLKKSQNAFFDFYGSTLILLETGIKGYEGYKLIQNFFSNFLIC